MAAAFLKSLFTKAKDPKSVKTIRLGAFNLLANAEHPIEQYIKDHPNYSANLPRISNYIAEKYPSFSVIDVGANIGDTIALLRNAGNLQQIHCIEGDPFYFDLLTQNAQQFEAVTLTNAFLGDIAGNVAFAIDAQEGT